MLKNYKKFMIRKKNREENKIKGKKNLQKAPSLAF
jgi:hypothetical protein